MKIFLKGLLFLFITISFVITSFLVVRVDIQKPIRANGGEIISFVDLPDVYTTSFHHVSGGENFRGFPFPVISSPYTHNSSSIGDFNILYNFAFYFFVVYIFLVLKYRKKD